jgi:hypothetical protein
MLGIVVVQIIYYCRHAQTNKTHIVAMVVSLTFRRDAGRGGDGAVLILQSVAVGLTVIATILSVTLHISSPSG